MKDKQFNIRFSDGELSILSSISQKLHLPYSKVIILALTLLNEFTNFLWNGKTFSRCSEEEYDEIVLHVNLWKKIL